jgi:hypothetical protein
MEGARRLCSFARLWIRRSFSHGLATDAADALSRLFVTARHLGREPLYMTKVMGWAFENAAVELAAAHLLQLAEHICRDLANRLSTMPDAAGLPEAARGEKRYTENYPESKYRESKWEKHELVLQMFCSANELRAIRSAVGGDPGRLWHMYHDLIPLYDPLADIMSLPPDRCQAGLIAFERTHRKENPLVVSLVRTAEGICFADTRARTRIAMLQTALAIRLEGTDAGERITDPTTGRPFLVRSFRGGFELSSPTRWHGRPPLVLTVGERVGWLRRWFPVFG